MKSLAGVLKGNWKYVVFWMAITFFWWAFAFFPLKTYDAEWLLRARTVCFGLSEHGLPNAGGWILLVLGPISLFVCLWFIVGSEVKKELHSAQYGATRKKIVLGLLVLLTAQIAWASTKAIQISRQNKVLSSYSTLDQVGGLPENYSRLDSPAPDFKLIDQFGKLNSLDQYKDKVILVVFAFAHCSSVCPGLVHLANTALDQIKDPNMNAVFITLDPERDTPSSLPSLSKRWALKSNSVVLSGSVKAVHEVLDQYKIPHIKDEKTGQVDHPAIVAMIDKKGKLAYYFNNPSQQWIIDAANKLLKE